MESYQEVTVSPLPTMALHALAQPPLLLFTLCPSLTNLVPHEAMLVRTLFCLALYCPPPPPLLPTVHSQTLGPDIQDPVTWPHLTSPHLTSPSPTATLHSGTLFSCLRPLLRLTP